MLHPPGLEIPVVSLGWAGREGGSGRPPSRLDNAGPRDVISVDQWRVAVWWRLALAVLVLGDPARGEGMTQAGAARTAARPSPARAAGGMETNVSAETSDS